MSVHSQLASLDRPDRVLLGAVVGLLPLTVVLSVLPVSGHAIAPHLDLVLDTTALIVTLLVAALLWVRYRESYRPIALLQSAAFLALAAGYVVAVGVSVATDGQASGALADRGPQQQQIFTASRAIAAALLVVGGVASLRGVAVARAGALASPVVVYGVPLAVLGSVVVATQLGALAPLVTVTPGIEPHATLTPLGVGSGAAVAALTLGAAIVCRRMWRRDRVVGDAYTAFALLLASAAQLQAAMIPSLHPIQVSASDALWLAFDMTMLLGVEAEARSALVALRRAHGELAVLRQAELERAAAEERNRLSRELHDGLSQNLWFVKLKAARLGELLTDAAERALVDEVSEGIDEALADARQAVMALRVGPGGDDSLGSLLRRYVEDFADRFAVRVRVAVDREIPRQSYRTEAELLHVAHEALMNTVRHADASLVQVRLEMSHAELSLSVVDNGRGFDSGVVHGGSFGLRGIRERAEILGGRCSIDSRLHDGTRLVVTVPLGGAAVDPRAGSGQAVPA